MHKAILAILLAASATAAQAAVEIDFNNPTGSIGTSHTYSGGGLSVTAYGVDFGLNPVGLFGKNNGGDENGVGVVTDPSGDHEIWTGTDFAGGAIVLDVSDLLANSVTEAQFSMGSTTAGEGWTIYGFNGVSFVNLLSGNDELTWHDLPGWGSYLDYAFTATNAGDNVLLGALSLTQSVPEPATWAMMLLGFGAMGVAFRRQKRSAKALVQVA